MANLPETSSFDANVNELLTTDLVLGGAGGPANLAPQSLTNRTRWLYDANAANVASITAIGVHLSTIDGEITSIFGSITAINANLASINGQLPQLAPLANPGFSGVPTAPTPPGGNNSTRIATTAFVANATSTLAPLISPALTGSPTAPTQTLGDASTKIATTAFVNPGSSLAASGYRKNPDGSIEQWGSYSVASGLTVPVDLGISFPIAFPHAVFGVNPVADRRVGASGQALDGSNFASQKTTSGCTITVDNNGAGTFVGTWRAVGW